MSRDFIGSAIGRSFLKSPNRDRVARSQLLPPGILRLVTLRTGKVHDSLTMYTKLRVVYTSTGSPFPERNFVWEQLWDFGEDYYTGGTIIFGDRPVPILVSESGRHDEEYPQFRFIFTLPPISDDGLRIVYDESFPPGSGNRTLELEFEGPVERDAWMSPPISVFLGEHGFPGPSTVVGVPGLERFLGYDTRYPNYPIDHTQGTTFKHVVARAGIGYAGVSNQSVNGAFPRALLICEGALTYFVPIVGFSLSKTSVGISAADRVLFVDKSSNDIQLACEQNVVLPGGVLAVSLEEALGYYSDLSKFPSGFFAADTGDTGLLSAAIGDTGIPDIDQMAGLPDFIPTCFN